MRKQCLLFSLIVLVMVLFVPIVQADDSVSAEPAIPPNPSKQILIDYFTAQTQEYPSETQRIMDILTVFFDARRSRFENPGLADFDFSIFWGDASPAQMENLHYFERSVKLYKELFFALSSRAVTPRTNLTFKQISISEKEAVVECYEELVYTHYSQKNGLNSFESAIGLAYRITLRQYGTTWLIVNIEFYDEATERLRDTNVSIESIVARTYESATTPMPSEVIHGGNQTLDPQYVPVRDFEVRPTCHLIR